LCDGAGHGESPAQLQASAAAPAKASAAVALARVLPALPLLLLEGAICMAHPYPLSPRMITFNNLRLRVAILTVCVIGA
jgi:hypothetical protein